MEKVTLNNAQQKQKKQKRFLLCASGVFVTGAKDVSLSLAVCCCTCPVG